MVQLVRSGPFHFASVYRLPGGSVDQFVEILENSILYVTDNIRFKLLIPGDINNIMCVRI